MQLPCSTRQRHKMTRRNLFKSLLGLCGIGFVAESNHSKYTWSREKFWTPPLTPDQLRIFNSTIYIRSSSGGSGGFVAEEFCIQPGNVISIDPGIKQTGIAILRKVNHG